MTTTNKEYCWCGWEKNMHRPDDGHEFKATPMSDLSARPPLSEQPDAVVIGEADIKWLRHHASILTWPDIYKLCDSHERLRSQVSTLTGQLAASTDAGEDARHAGGHDATPK